MCTSLSKFLLTVAACCFTLTGPVSAQAAPDDAASNGIERISAARGLRTLSQQIPASTCHLSADIEADISEIQLSTALSQFERTLDALEFGDVDLGMPNAEDRRLTIAAIQQTRDEFMPVKAASENVLSGNASDADRQAIYMQTPAVLSAVEHLLVEVIGQYFNPTEMVKADSFLIDIAGRQGMLIQQMSKDSCLMSTNQNSPETTAEMETAMSVFDASLGALRNGLPSAGLRPPPTPAIADGLEAVWNEWGTLKPMLESISGGTEMELEAETARLQKMNEMTATMNEVVGLYFTALK